MKLVNRVSFATLVMLTAATVFLAGCDSLLDLSPQQSIEEGTALSTSQNVEAALVGAYDMMGDYDLFGGQFMMLSDLLADDGELNWTGTFAQPRELWTKQILVNNSFVEDQWVDSYNAINITNNVLSALDVVDAADRDRVEGEAKFIRGTLYFELVRRFGKAYNDGDPSSNAGVPIVLEPTHVIGEENNVPRSMVADVYDQAIADLTDARDLLPLPEDNGFFANTYGASAVLSRIYLMQSDYAAAAAEADRVIEEGGFELMDDYDDAFNNPEDVSEYVFAMQVTLQDGDHSLNTFYGSEGNNGRADIDITDAHLDLYEDDDARGEFFYSEDDAVWTTKWANGVDGNIPVIRLAEMYLTRAEANFRAGTTVGDTPLNDINTIRDRAGLDDLDAGDLDLDAILLERKLELSFEGHTLHDLKRNEDAVGDFDFDDNRLVYPIPEREIDANPNMEQNPDYGS